MLAVGSKQESPPLTNIDKKSATQAEPTLSAASPAHKMEAVTPQNVSSTAHIIAAVTDDQPAQDKARGERKHGEKHRTINIDRSIDTFDMQNEAQKIKNTDTLSPVELLTLMLEQQGASQTNKDASSRRRGEPLDTREEPASTQPGSLLEPKPSVPPAFPVQRVSTPNTAAKRWRSPQSTPRPSESNEAEDIAAQRLRLLALQKELGQLKRTPSMQLLARQRIPRLEEAIKHLIASLTESA
jgi:hypothetical protein